MKKTFKNFSILFVLILSLGVLVTGCSADKDHSLEDNLTNTREGMDVKQENDLTGDRNINKGTAREPNDNGFVGKGLDNDSNIINDRDMNNNEVNDNEFNDRDMNIDSMADRSRTISDKLNQIEGISNANVIITGKTALVGIDIPANTEDAKSTEIKNTVQTKVKAMDKEIDNVVVTADADLTNRIKNVGTDIKGGKPISGLGGEIEEIIRRITPNM